MKKIIALAMAFVLMLGCVPAMAEGEPEYKNVKIEVDGEKIILLDAEEEQQKSIIIDGTVYVPIEYFVAAIGGEAIYDAANNQIIITLAPSAENGAANDSATDGEAYADADIVAKLPTGRWTQVSERGNASLEFFSDYTGKVSGQVDSTWSVQDGVVTVCYTAQGHDMKKAFRFEERDGDFLLVDASGEFVLNAESNKPLNPIGAWYAVETDAVVLMFTPYACRIDTPDKGYTGTWTIDAENIYLRLANLDSTVVAAYDNESISLTVEGKSYTFTR